MKTVAPLALASLASLALLPATRCLAAPTLASPSLASPGPVGIWRTADGTATVAIRSCGDALCGYVASATSHQDTTVGRQVFFNMRPHGDEWSGTIVNIIDGQHYAGNISLVNDGKLRVEGCILGGIFCGDQQWVRVR